MLTINPSAFLFNQIATAPSAIEHQGFLRVPDGKSLLLVGGNVNLDFGYAWAFGGRVEIGGVAESGSVGLTVAEDNLSLSFPDNTALADVSLTDGSRVNVSAEDGGSIAINARDLNLTESTLQAGIRSGADSINSQGKNINIELNAIGSINLNDSSIINNISSIAPGQGGNINIKTGSLFLTNGAQLTTETFGAGNAGNININARETVSFDGGDPLLPSAALANAEFGATGNAGNVYIKTGSLSMTDNAALIADTGGRGQAGDINLDVKGAILLAGGNPAPTGESTRITLGVQPQGIGSGGNLDLKAGSLVLTDGAIIKTSTQGQGEAGNIEIKADVVDISSSVPSSGLPSGFFTSTDTSFRAGNIVVNAPTFRLADGAALSARTRGDGAGGNIRVNAIDLFEATNGGQLVTIASGRGQAGNIFINATNRITLSGSDPNYSNRIAKFPINISQFVANNITETGAASGLFASTTSGSTSNGGSIFINPRTVILQDGARIAVDSQRTGH